MKRLLFPLFSASIFSLVFACNSKPESTAIAAEPLDALPAAAPAMSMGKMAVESTAEPIQNEQTIAGTSASEIPIDKKKLIRDGNLSLKTMDLQACKSKTDALLKQYKAYYENEDLQNTDQSTIYNLKIRVPSESFDALLIDLEKGEDEITNKNIQTRDVTQEYIDAEARLNNKRAYLARYRELLSKAANVSDIITIEENIRNIQEEIESKEGQLKYLNDQIAYSTLYLSIVKDKPFEYKPEAKAMFSERVKKSLANGWSGIVDTCLSVITLWPWLILVSLVGMWLYIRRKKTAKS